MHLIQVPTSILGEKGGLTERLFMRRCSTSSMESFVRSAITFNGIVLFSEGRLQGSKFKFSQQ
jgi:hypothetical protein